MDIKEINAIHDDDLEIVLKKLYLLEKIQKGTIKCCYCDEPITIQNIYAIKREESEIHIVCDNSKCIKDFLSNTPIRGKMESKR